MDKKVIGVDFDDVLKNFMSGFAAFHNNNHGTAVKYEDIFTFELHQVFDCSQTLMKQSVLDFYGSPEHAVTEPIPGAVDAIQYLSQKFYLDIITSRPESARIPTSAWRKRFVPTGLRDCHFTNWYVNSEASRRRLKSEVCAEIKAQVLIEDVLHNAEDVAKSGVPVLLPDRPWNRDCTPPGVVRVHSWKEIVDWIEANL